ncbi:MAG: ABC transporter ATP-binding protein [Acidobacteriia bacterium]|nr:ABC transporter ATP-binding protein [Terriglobia bacterium]
MLKATLKKKLTAFDLEVSLEVEKAFPLVIVGENGAGKTTVLNLLTGLVPPDEGRVELNGKIFCDTARGFHLAPEHREIGYVFQDAALFSHLTVYENVAFGLRARRVPDREVEHRVREMLHRFGIWDLAASRPGKLSGGQKQQVALARALVTKPRLLLLDEAMAALDYRNRREVRNDLRFFLKDENCITLLVTHQPLEAMAFGEKVAVLEQGKIVQLGAREELLRRPRTPYVAELMGVNFFQGRVVARASDGLCEVRTENGILHLLAEEGREDVFIAVDPREITLHTSAPSGTAQNVFEGAILELLPEPPLGERVRVVLGTHPSIVAEVTIHAVRTLALREGISVYASFKATAARSYN